MNISIRTRRLGIRSRLRSRIENYLRTVLRREQEHVTMVTLYMTDTPIAGSYTGFACRLVLLSSRTGRIVVNAEGARLTTALRHVTHRGRAVVRQRSKKTVERYHGVRTARQQYSEERV